MASARELVDRLFAHIDAKEFDRLSEVAWNDCEIVMPYGRFDDLGGLAAMMRSYSGAFPDGVHEIMDWIDDGRTAAAQVRATATHTGPLPTPQGELPATGKTVVWESGDFFTFSDGKIASWRVYWDNAAFLAQLGLLPADLAT
jgi:steroid delta-isomerase-like uncharacterized protein